MSQLTIYLDEETEKKVKKAAEASGVSRSKWIRDLIRRHTSKEWPRNIVELSGSWPDFPDAEELREDLPPASPREEF